MEPSQIELEIAVWFGSYLFGSLPIGLIVARQWKGIDIRQHGSGNIGATNVFRTVGPAAGTLVFILDVLKGFLPPLVAGRLIPGSSLVMVAAALCAILGHNFSPFLKFKGGKGISTSLGTLIAIAPMVGLIAFGLWAVLLLITRYVSVGSIASALSLPLLTPLFYQGDPYRMGYAVAACLFALIKHIPNIKRLLNGTENKCGTY